MGYHVVTLKICPIEYIPSEQKINLYTNIDFDIEYENIPTSIRQARRQSLFRYNTVKKTIKNMVENPSDFETVTGGAIEVVDGQTGMYKLDFRTFPTLEGTIPDYIIITNNELKPIFEELAEWKTRKGIPALMVTLQEINSNYTGCDLQEKLRHYLQDARYYWGEGLYILLSGDTNIIPDRLTEYPYYDNGVLIVDMIPSDLYYSDVYDSGNPDYNFNGDGDNIFGEDEDEDELDYGFDLVVGIASVEDETEATTFVNKVISYEKLDNPNFDINDVNNVLLMAAFSNEDWHLDMTDQYYIYEDDLPTVNVPNGWIQGWKMFDDYDCSHGDPWHNPYPGHEETTHDHFVVALNNDNGTGFSHGNFHIVYHAAHSSPYRMGTSAKMKGESINRFDIDNLNNIPYQILMSCGCKPNRFNLDCICEHYINNPENGGVAVVGNSCVGYCGDSTPQFRNFVVNLYGKEDNMWESNKYHMGSLFQSMPQYPYYDDGRESLNLLGDPEMPVWSDAPQDLIVEVSPSEVTIGQNSVTVTIDNLPNEKDATICLQKGSEAYGRQTVTGTGNQVNTEFIVTADTEGELSVTITSHNFFPYEDIIPVNPSPASHLYITDNQYDDDQIGESYGNNDGVLDAGETIEQTITLTNNGSADALDVSAELICSSDIIDFDQNQSDFGNISAGASATSQINYVFEIDKEVPDAEYVTDTLYIYESDQLLHTDVFNIQISAPIIDKIQNTVMTSDGDDVIEAGEAVGTKMVLIKRKSVNQMQKHMFI